MVFVGTSVGERSAHAGHYCANSTNRFWQLLEAAGLTEGATLTSERDTELLDHAIGITDLVKGRTAHPTAFSKRATTTSPASLTAWSRTAR